MVLTIATGVAVASLPCSLQTSGYRLHFAAHTRNPLRRSVKHMPIVQRAYEPHDFAALHRLDQSCFPQGVAYSRATLHYFLMLPTSDCTVALDGKSIVGFILAEQNPPLAHIITLDVATSRRRQGIGSALLAESEKSWAYRSIKHVLLETAVENDAAVAFWQRHGYRIEAVLKRYYLGRFDAYEMRKIVASAA
jgi:[ribosomal protein S18]-alanine N-acetyltransferase